ncbi:toprim domain-containing protein [Emticicia sp. TH156]|uniref:toprim domain-containing protein n=1 Tax=Emticicia sp. TH156 TaxID=2067454 RepID=UPI000C757EBB|nr:toprim domain-containing protein [Emticicia sp. TH156]PLK45797.1 DNA primase [Emticicia sp. TH156]
MEKLTCATAKKIDMVDYLISLGHLPQQVTNGSDYWYRSPLREELTASFKVNRKLNVYYDHGTGKGGDLIDFGKAYFGCTISELLGKLSTSSLQPFLYQPSINAGEKKENQESKIVIAESRVLSDAELLAYLNTRKIPLDIARQYCHEVDFLLYGKKQTAIGFRNNSGGYELRNEGFKGSSSPKDLTLITDKKTEALAVFEGFFDFLSFQLINRNKAAPLSNYLVLNSLSLLEKSRDLMEGYQHIHLFLDRDKAGVEATLKVLEWENGRRDKFIDYSNFYSGFQDLNDWLKSCKPEIRQSYKHGKSL